MLFEIEICKEQRDGKYTVSANLPKLDVHLCQDRQVKVFFHSVLMVFCCTLNKSIVQIFALLI